MVLSNIKHYTKQIDFLYFNLSRNKHLTNAELFFPEKEISKYVNLKFLFFVNL